MIRPPFPPKGDASILLFGVHALRVLTGKRITHLIDHLSDPCEDAEDEIRSPREDEHRQDDTEGNGQHMVIPSRCPDGSDHP